jgi:hypothetical protein
MAVGGSSKTESNGIVGLLSKSPSRFVENPYDMIAIQIPETGLEFPDFKHFLYTYTTCPPLPAQSFIAPTAISHVPMANSEQIRHQKPTKMIMQQH